MNGLLGAVSLLTRVPVAARIESEFQIARSVPWFPVVGAGVGAVMAGVYAGASLMLPPLICAVLAVAAGLVLTGAFHEDGLADVADAFAGGWERDDVIRILKDPAHGTYGVLAIAVSLAIRAAAVSQLSPAAAAAVLPAAHAVSRSAAIWVMANFPPVAEGLGASYARSLTGFRALIGVALGVAVSMGLLGWWGLSTPVLLLFPAWWLGRLSHRRIGGLSGDVLGAVQQVSEVLVLLLAVGLVRADRAGFPWFAS